MCVIARSSFLTVIFDVWQNLQHSEATPDPADQDEGWNFWCCDTLLRTFSLSSVILFCVLRRQLIITITRPSCQLGIANNKAKIHQLLHRILHVGSHSTNWQYYMSDKPVSRGCLPAFVCCRQCCRCYPMPYKGRSGSSSESTDRRERSTTDGLCHWKNVDNSLICKGSLAAINQWERMLKAEKVRKESVLITC